MKLVHIPIPRSEEKLAPGAKHAPDFVFTGQKADAENDFHSETRCRAYHKFQSKHANALQTAVQTGLQPHPQSTSIGCSVFQSSLVCHMCANRSPWRYNVEHNMRSKLDLYLTFRRWHCTQRPDNTWKTLPTLATVCGNRSYYVDKLTRFIAPFFHLGHIAWLVLLPCRWAFNDDSALRVKFTNHTFT